MTFWAQIRLWLSLSVQMSDQSTYELFPCHSVMPFDLFPQLQFKRSKFNRLAWSSQLICGYYSIMSATGIFLHWGSFKRHIRCLIMTNYLRRLKALNWLLIVIKNKTNKLRSLEYAIKIYGVYFSLLLQNFMYKIIYYLPSLL